MMGFLDRDHSVAGPGYNRWLVPPASLSVHLAIGQVYGFSVFNLPMTRLLGITQPARGDWKLTTQGWIFSLAIVVLGLSAALGGKWVERAGPRKAMFASACCFSWGFLVAAFGVRLHNFFIVSLGYGLLGGIGMGLGYVAPVKTLIDWFPDRPGLATGMAIMGFGGGAMIGSPLAVALMDHFRSATTMGVWETFVAMGLGYFIFMMLGVGLVRVPRPGWRPEGFVPAGPQKLVTAGHVSADNAIRTRQFWCLWLVLFFNVTAGIGVLGQASAMAQEIFKGRITPVAAGGFVGLMSLFNMGGRFLWSSASDYLGRKFTYSLFFALGGALFAFTLTAGRMGSVGLFVATFALIMSMYGGGFATIPAYLRDIFGAKQVSAIHGRLLTAWSAAGLAGPGLVNYIREYQIEHGVAPAHSYFLTMYLMSWLLVFGFLCNHLVSEVDPRFFDRQDA
jgi:MFS family permease